MVFSHTQISPVVAKKFFALYSAMKTGSTVIIQRGKSRDRLEPNVKGKIDAVREKARQSDAPARNARPHIAKVVKTDLDSLKWKILFHPPYTLNIAPSDSYLF